MKKIALIPLALAALLVLAGCIESTTVVRVKPDGSGTIEQTLIFSDAFSELLSGFGGEEEASEEGFVDVEELKRNASAIGEGVRFVSAEDVQTETGSGYTVVYEFEDINQVRVNQNPGGLVPSAPGAEDEGSPEEFVLFNFEKGRTATLEIINPIDTAEQREAEERAEVEMDAEAAGMMEMMAEFYRDMKLAMIVEVDGRIVETNATYRDGSRVTIMELDFGKLMEDPDKFQALMQSNPETVEEVKEIAKDIPGVKVETEESIVIRFR